MTLAPPPCALPDPELPDPELPEPEEQPGTSPGFVPRIPEARDELGRPAPEERLDSDDAEALGERIQQQAALIAEATCELLLMLAEFDAREGVGHYWGLKSTAHWLSWACSMAPGTAREHVRVARALPSMPLTTEEFRAGRLSYSKVREMTRVADRVEEEALVELARAMTAAQLARTVSAFCAVDGGRLGQDANRRASWYVREDGMVEIRAVLPAELGAEMMTALELSLDRDDTAPPPAERTSAEPADETQADEEHLAEITTEATLEQRRADALHDLARTYLATEPDDRSGEDRHLVVVQVGAEALERSVPAGTPAPTATDVPAGTSQRCGILDAGPLETTTAERLACTGKVALVITDEGGEVLHLGRSQRLATRAQRRALRLRDTTCSFPGCHQIRHLDAHHTTPWAHGGLTDIEDLALLCRRHHVMVHEGGFRLMRDPARQSPHQPRFLVVDGESRQVQARWPAMFEHVLSEEVTAPPSAGSPTDPDPTRIAATTGGAGFHLSDCVDALLQNVVQLAA